MRVMLKHYDIRASIEVDRDDLTINEALEELIKPVLLAAGWGEVLVDRIQYVEETDDDSDS